MSDKTFRRLLWIVTAAGVASVIALAVVTYILYRDVSILTYVANGR